MNRALIVAGAGAIVCSSYIAVIFGIAPATTVGPIAFASIALPGIVTGFVMAAYVIWETRNAREAKQHNNELSAQLIRKDIEIGRLSTVDELTGLYTRREFDEFLRLEFHRYRRHQRPMSFLILEIDDVADLDAQIGQLGKGLLLAEVSSILKHGFRAIDLGCRYTNDSLALLLPETDAPRARVVAGRIQAAVAQHEFPRQRYESEAPITVSQGIGVVSLAMATHVELMRAAEQALYAARATGVDQVKVVEAPPLPENTAA